MTPDQEVTLALAAVADVLRQLDNGQRMRVLSTVAHLYGLTAPGELTLPSIHPDRWTRVPANLSPLPPPPAVPTDVVAKPKPKRITGSKRKRSK